MKPLHYRILSVLCFVSALILGFIDYAHASDADDTPTIVVAAVPASPTPPPQLALPRADRFAISSVDKVNASPNPGSSDDPNSIAVIATSADTQNPSASCAVLIDHGQIENVCVGDPVQNTRLASVDPDGYGITLANGHHITVGQNASGTIGTTEVPGIAGSSGLANQSVPVNISQPARAAAPLGLELHSNIPVPTSRPLAPVIAPTPQPQTPGSMPLIPGQLGQPGQTYQPSQIFPNPQATPLGLPTPSIISPQAAPTPVFINAQ